jgi:hypothetical protein
MTHSADIIKVYAPVIHELTKIVRLSHSHFYVFGHSHYKRALLKIYIQALKLFKMIIKTDIICNSYKNAKLEGLGEGS